MNLRSSRGRQHHRHQPGTARRRDAQGATLPRPGRIPHGHGTRWSARGIVGDTRSAGRALPTSIFSRARCPRHLRSPPPHALPSVWRPGSVRHPTTLMMRGVSARRGHDAAGPTERMSEREAVSLPAPISRVRLSRTLRTPRLRRGDAPGPMNRGPRSAPKQPIRPISSRRTGGQRRVHPHGRALSAPRIGRQRND